MLVGYLGSGEVDNFLRHHVALVTHKKSIYIFSCVPVYLLKPLTNILKRILHACISTQIMNMNQHYSHIILNNVVHTIQIYFYKGLRTASVTS